jgi:hypothetical protein
MMIAADGAASFCFEAFSSRELASTPDHVRGHASLQQRDGA